jgi:hypothetical protein
MSEISNARNIDEFLEKHLGIIKVKDDEKQKIFLESWKQTMDELDPETKVSYVQLQVGNRKQHERTSSRFEKF